jgi:hypothetical protein
MYEGGPPNPVMVSHYRHEISEAKLVISKAKGKLQEALAKLDKLDEPYNAPKRRESNVKVAVETKRTYLDKNRKSKLGFICKLQVNGHIQFELRPSRALYDSGRGMEKFQV